MIKEVSKEKFDDVKNALSNDQADEATKPNESSSDFVDDMRDEAKIIAKNTARNRAKYEQGLRDEQAIIDSMRGASKKTKSTQVKVNGDVTVSFSFVNPTRQSVFHDVPAYMCEGGGRVVINVTVNNNGDVVGASVDKNRSTTDQCIISTALNAAKKFRFNINSSAPEKHQGEISYIFIPQ